MKGKITDSLKPPITNRPSEVCYRKLNEMPESGERLRQKQYEETMANEQSQNGRGEYQIDEIDESKKEVSLNA